MARKTRKVPDLTGKKFGRWTVLERRELEGPHVGWLCRCECGTERVQRGATLRDGRSLSCGCYRRDVVCLPKGESAFRSLYSQYARGAKRRGFGWNLSKAEFRVLTLQDCHYCGVAPFAIKSSDGRGGGNGYYIYNGIDRVNNSLGYIPENVVTCCRHCNRAKRTRDVEDFAAWIVAAHQHLTTTHWGDEILGGGE